MPKTLENVSVIHLNFNLNKFLPIKHLRKVKVSILFDQYRVMESLIRHHGLTEIATLKMFFHFDR